MGNELSDIADVIAEGLSEVDLHALCEHLLRRISRETVGESRLVYWIYRDDSGGSGARSYRAYSFEDDD